jgi:hypothetical protein
MRERTFVMTENLSDKEIEDINSRTAATVWDHLPGHVRKALQQNMGPNERNDVAQAVQHGRRLIRGK